MFYAAQGSVVLYRPRPGQIRAGGVDISAFVTKVYPDHAVDLLLIPPDGETSHQHRVPCVYPGATGHFYHPTPDILRVIKLEQELEALREVVRSRPDKPQPPRLPAPLEKHNTGPGRPALPPCPKPGEPLPPEEVESKQKVPA